MDFLEWTPISDPPPLFTPILVYSEGRRGEGKARIEIGYLKDDGVWMTAGKKNLKVQFWMPLPPLPGKERG